LFDFQFSIQQSVSCDSSILDQDVIANSSEMYCECFKAWSLGDNNHGSGRSRAGSAVIVQQDGIDVHGCPFRECGRPFLKQGAARESGRRVPAIFFSSLPFGVKIAVHTIFFPSGFENGAQNTQRASIWREVWEAYMSVHRP
jgi:hypothetical protein